VAKTPKNDSPDVPDCRLNSAADNPISDPGPFNPGADLPSITLVKIGFTPFVCSDCGQLLIQSDHCLGVAVVNCDSCEGDNVSKAGPEQTMTVNLYRRAVPAFNRGEE
jgi:hypothetical protein